MDLPEEVEWLPYDPSRGYVSEPFDPDRVVLSPSQIDIFGKCLRKGAIRYTLGVKTIPRPWFQFGTTGHRYLEDWFRHGTEIDTLTKEGSLAHKGLDFLPHRDDVAPPEAEFRFKLTDKIWMRGAIDLYDNHNTFTVYDYKFYSDLTYAHTPETLAEDIPANTYCYVTGLERASWLYFQKGRKKVASVNAEIPLDKSRAFMQSLIPMARLIREVRMVPADQVNDIPHNPEICEYNGTGCDQSTHCNIMKGIKMTMSPVMQEKLAQIKAKASNKVNPPESEKVVAEEIPKEVETAGTEVVADTAAPEEEDIEAQMAALQKKAKEQKAAKTKAEKAAKAAAKAAAVKEAKPPAAPEGSTTVSAPAGSTITITTTVTISPAAE